MKARLGAHLLPALTRLSGWFLEKGLPALEKFGGGFKALGELMGNGNFSAALREAFGWEEDSRAVTALLRIRDAAIVVWDRLKQFGGWIANDLWPALQRGYNEVLPALKKAWSDLTGGVGGADIKWREIGRFITDVAIPIFVKVAQVYIPMMVAHFKILGGAIKFAWAIFQSLGDVIRIVVSGALTAFASMARGFAAMLRGLAVIPGFGWAKTAADKLENAARKADGFKAAINRVPNSKQTNFAANTGTAIGSVRALEAKIAGVRGKSVTISVHYAYSQSGSVYRSQVPAAARAAGGPVVRGMTYLVGENGPEMFTASSTGHITPARQTAETLTGGSRRRGSSTMTDDRPIVVQLMADGRLLQEVLVKRKRATGQNLGLA